MELTDIIKIVCSPDMFPTITLTGWTDENIKRCIDGAVTTYFDEPAQEAYFRRLAAGDPIETALVACAFDHYSRFDSEKLGQSLYTTDDEKLTHLVAMNMYPATKCHYIDLLLEKMPVSEAFFWAILNDFLIDAIQSEIRAVRANEEDEDE